MTDLYVHLDDCLANESGSKEGPERDEEMTAGYAGQIKQRIGYLNRGKPISSVLSLLLWEDNIMW